MTTTSIKSYVLAALATLTTLALTASAEARPAFEARGDRQLARWEAAPATRSNEVSTRRGNFSRTSEADIAADGDSAYRSRTLTGPDGKSGRIFGTVERTQDGYSASKTVTDSNGDTAGRSASGTVEEGRFTRNREGYSRSGATASGSDTIERTDDGASRSSTFETSTGRGGALESDVTRTDDGGAFNRTATNADGETVATRNTTVTNDEDGVSKTTTVTDANGEQYENSREWKKD